MGRTGTFFATRQLGISPDLITLAKAPGNGLPIGALLAGERAAARLRPGRSRLHRSGQSPSLPRLPPQSSRRSTTTCSRRPARGAQLVTGSRRSRPCARFAGAGSDRGGARPARRPVVDACREQGCSSSRPGPDVLRLTPPLVVSAAEVDRALAILEGGAAA
jgi:4-aminobutyrate aminotransferase-like enzyme